MHIKIFLKKLVSISVAACLAAALAGCFDLGDFDDETAYYAAFGDVGLVFQNPENKEKDVEIEEYSIKDYFYNKNTGNDYTYGDPSDEEPDEGKDIPQLPYVYMAIPLEKDLKVDSLALYFNGTQTCSLDVYVYVVKDLPDGGDFSTIRLWGEPEYKPKLDGDKPMYDEDGKPIQELIEYSDPDNGLITAKARVDLKEKEWVSLVVDTWEDGDVVEVKESQYILLRFINNSGLNNGEQPSVSFRVTNLLVRAIS